MCYLASVTLYFTLTSYSKNGTTAVSLMMPTIILTLSKTKRHTNNQLMTFDIC